MGFGLYSVKDPSQFVTGSMGGAAATASKMMKEPPQKPGPSAGGAIATGVAGAMLGATVASDVGRAKGLQKTVKEPGVIPKWAYDSPELMKEYKDKRGITDSKMTQGKFEKYGAGIGAVGGVLAHILS